MSKLYSHLKERKKEHDSIEPGSVVAQGFPPLGIAETCKQKVTLPFNAKKHY